MTSDQDGVHAHLLRCWHTLLCASMTLPATSDSLNVALDFTAASVCSSV
jgi:hypothetical protein